MRKKMMICLIIFGVLLIGTVSQVLAENDKPEGMTSGTSMSNQSEKPFFSKDNLIILAQIECSTYISIQACYDHWSSGNGCCWVNMNSQSEGYCAKCQ